MPFAKSKKLQAYSGHCPSCGSALKFEPPYRDDGLEVVQATCTKADCKRKWSMVFDLDVSGTFGVVSFQCDNEDRII